MAFTGVLVVTQVTKTLFRITGGSLAGNASGVIGFSEKSVPAEASIHAPDWKPFVLPDSTLVSLQQAVKAWCQPVTDVSAAVPVSIVKTGTTHLDFAITLHNDNAGGGQASAELEIYVEWGGR